VHTYIRGLSLGILRQFLIGNISNADTYMNVDERYVP
jgi:hypothetical protein